MKPQKQAFFHKPDEGIYGDCTRTVFACLLDMERDAVPHFGAGSPPHHVRSEHERQWLASQNLVEVSVAYEGDRDAILCTFGAQNTGLHYMLTGRSRTGCHHVVICRNHLIVWDTSIDDAGIIGPCDNGYYCISVLAKKL